jgi:hypothetical protein
VDGIRYTTIAKRTVRLHPCILTHVVVQIEASAIPPDLFKTLCAPHARKPTSWFKKAGAAMPAAAPPAPAPAPAAAASEDVDMATAPAPASNMMDVDAHAPLMPLHGDGDIVEL